MPDDPTPTLWFLLGALIAGHLVFGPRWIPDGCADIWAAWIRLGRLLFKRNEERL